MVGIFEFGYGPFVVTMFHACHTLIARVRSAKKLVEHKRKKERKKQERKQQQQQQRGGGGSERSNTANAEEKKKNPTSPKMKNPKLAIHLLIF
ncbi:Spore germination protein GerIA [Trichinella spiralis]|uniref:Spore germination protein GerIA n=1 Tax=Trichinella spiralis TaxID=6334 RepID=A0ABR3KAD3_TRISP